jgi:hypothetical protein
MGLSALTREQHANERPELLTHLLALYAEDRHLRFAHMLSDDGIRHYVEGIDLTRGAVFVVTGIDLEIIGAAHLARTTCPIGHFRFAAEPRPRYRRRSTRTLRGACPQLGYAVMFMNCLVENAAMMHLARRVRRRRVRALAARRPDQSCRGGSRRAARVIRPRPEILLGGAAGPTSAMKDFRRRTSKQTADYKWPMSACLHAGGLSGGSPGRWGSRRRGFLDGIETKQGACALARCGCGAPIGQARSSGGLRAVEDCDRDCDRA